MEESRCFFSCRYSSLHCCCHVMKRFPPSFPPSLRDYSRTETRHFPHRGTRAARPRGMPCASQVGNPDAQGVARAFCTTSSRHFLHYGSIIDYRGDSRFHVSVRLLQFPERKAMYFARLLKFAIRPYRSVRFFIARCTLALLAIPSRAILAARITRQ